MYLNMQHNETSMIVLAPRPRVLTDMAVATAATDPCAPVSGSWRDSRRNGSRLVGDGYGCHTGYLPATVSVYRTHYKHVKQYSRCYEQNITQESIVEKSLHVIPLLKL